jgi:NAD(P)-dependent dehydrogenase (short-subunit alcohol dehydrogenase family)
MSGLPDLAGKVAVVTGGASGIGKIHGVHTFLPILSGNPDGGHIVNTASMAGLVAHARLGAYSTAKYGVVALTEALAEELAADGSRVGVSQAAAAGLAR